MPVASAQNAPAPLAEVTGITVTHQDQKEIRIELKTSAPVPRAAVVATNSDCLILDLPDAVYRAVPQNISVNHAGIRTVQLWMQTDDPPLARVLIGTSQRMQYQISIGTNSVILRIGSSWRREHSSPAPDSSQAAGNRDPGPAARGSVSTNAIGALAGIFKRGPAKPAIYGKEQSLGQTPLPPENSSGKQEASSNPPLEQPVQSQAQTQPSSTAKITPQAAGATDSSNLDSIVLPTTPAEPRLAEDARILVGVPTANSATARRLPATNAADTSPPDANPTNSPSPPAEVVVNPGMRTEFHVKYVEQDSAYLDGGRNAGLAEGMKLLVRSQRAPTGSGSDPGPSDGPAAELVVVAVADTSAVTEIRVPKRDVVPGDVAYLSSADIQVLVQQHALGTTRKYPAVISFTEGGDALDEEAHAYVSRPPMPSVNRATGRLGFDYTGTRSNDSSQASSSSIGGVLRVDFTRIAGTYWNFRGYWRGRFRSSTALSQPTLQDLINRTYHLELTYENPNSRWVLGVGRLYLPWAMSLETLDGGYFGRRVSQAVTLGIFGGSTPDPTSWNYNPNRHIGGVFFNASGGSYDAVHFSTTAGAGKSFETDQYSLTTPTGTNTSSYQNNRPFAFLENTISFKRTFSIFHALQADEPSANPAVPSPGPGISRSFLSARLQPVSRIEFSLNHTYFRDIPTFDPQLVGTGLLDKYLFQGFSGGVRIEVVKDIAVYTDIGRSSRTGDAKDSLNQMYGLTFLKLPKVQLRADAHYSRFNSSFGSGTYRSVSLSRSLGDDFHFELLGGDQVFTSSLAGNQSAKFITSNMDTSLGAFLFLQGGFTAYRGQLQNYNQWMVTLGYRFDNKWKRK
jgi:hypothetical protein